MDDTMKVEFPVGSRTVTLSRPSENQLFAVTLLRMPADDASPRERHTLITRMLRFLERLAGPEQWREVEGWMLDEEIVPMDLLQLFEDVLKFPWAEHTPAADEPQEKIPDRPAPRVVSGG